MSRAEAGALAALLRARIGWAVLLVVGAALWARGPARTTELPEMGVGLGGLLLSLLFARGAVSGEIRSGAHLLWLQKGGRIGGRYALRFATLGLLVLALHLVAGVGLTLAGLAPPLSPGSVVALGLTDLGVVGLAFALSAAGVPLESVLSALLLVVLAGPAVEVALDPSTHGRWAGFLAPLRFPVLELRALALWVDGLGGRPPAVALLRATAWPFLAAAVGVLLAELRLTPLRLRGRDRPTPARTGPSAAPPPPPSGGARLR